jgi:ionotropic glutamate receptor
MTINYRGLDDLYKQYKIKYAPTQGSASETYFRRMAEIEAKFYEYVN